MDVQKDPTPPVRQVLRCSRLLREGWHSKSELARRLDMSERTVKRYLRAIAAEEEGFEVREVDERGLRKYRLHPPRVVDRRRGSPFEVMALAMAQRFFEAFDPGGVADLLDQVLFEVTGEVYVLRPYTLLLGERELAITGPVGEPPEDGMASDNDTMRTFALHRIIDIDLRMTRFRMPSLSQWDPERLYSGAWGLYSGDPERVRVEVHPDFAEVIAERRWHESQEVGEAAPDGWLSMQFDVFTGGEFRTWLLGWGPWLRVVEPAHLGEWLAGLNALSPGEGDPGEDEVFRIV